MDIMDMKTLKSNQVLDKYVIAIGSSSEGAVRAYERIMQRAK